MSTDQTHGNALGDEMLATTCHCGCGRSFKPRRFWQRFATFECRAAYHARTAELGLRGKVSSCRRLARGGVSITVRFEPADADGALRFFPGESIKIGPP